MKWLSSRIQALGANLLALFCGSIPLPLQLDLADFLGRLVYWFVPERRNVALENLRLIYGDALTPSERRAIARQSIQRLVRVFVETAFINRMLATSRTRARRLRLKGDWAGCGTMSPPGAAD